MGMNVGGAGPRADINITPLIDVLLVLIIIFLVCHNRSLGLDAVIPQPGPQRAEPPARTIVVQLSEDGSLHINQEAVEADRLGPRLFDIFKARAEKVCFVRANPGIEFQRVAQVIDVARGAGVTQVGLMKAETPAGNLSRR